MRKNIKYVVAEALLAVLAVVFGLARAHTHRKGSKMVSLINFRETLK